VIPADQKKALLERLKHAKEIEIVEMDRTMSIQ